MPLLSRARRTRRPKEWNEGAAVTFIVTLAASRSVTLAARAAGMSRKSVYALRDRDPVFAAAWAAALRAGEGDKVEEVKDPPGSPVQGDSAVTALRSRRTTGLADAARRDAYFGRLAGRLAAARPQAVEN